MPRQRLYFCFPLDGIAMAADSRTLPSRQCCRDYRFHTLTPRHAQVRTYEDYITFLMERDPRIRRDELPFEGRNIVLYMEPAPVPA